MEKWDAEKALQLIRAPPGHRHAHGARRSSTVSCSCPTSVRARYDVSSLRQVIHAAAPCPMELKRRLFDWLGPVIYEFYGATEGGGTIAKPQDWLAHPGTVGPPVAGRRREGPRRRRQRGSPGHGRHGLPEAHGGRLPLQGRPRQDDRQPARRLLHRRGHGRARRRRLPLPAGPQDRHDHLGRRQHLPGRGRGGAALPPRGGRRGRLRDPRRGVGRAGQGRRRARRPATRASPALAEELQAHCAELLAKYKCPRSIDFTEAMPRDPNGKLYKRRLRDPYWEGSERGI